MYYRRLKFCIIYLALNRGCFEAVLMKNTPRTLGVKLMFIALLSKRSCVTSRAPRNMESHLDLVLISTASQLIVMLTTLWI
jgi:hypothetical protein